MSLYPLGISRSRDLGRAAGEVTAGRVAVRWVLADELAGAVFVRERAEATSTCSRRPVNSESSDSTHDRGDPPQGPPSPLEHAAALAAIHRQICVLPMRFGTVLRDEAEIRSLLEVYSRDLVKRLDRLAGTCEMGLRIALPTCRIPQPNPWPATSPSISYFAKRRAHYQRRDWFGRRARLTVERVVEELRGTYRDWRWLTRSPPGVVRLAFLVEREGVRRFAGRLSASRTERPGEQPTLLGPWPPYSFVGFDPERRHPDAGRPQPVHPM
jgi:hypothetical protein